MICCMAIASFLTFSLSVSGSLICLFCDAVRTGDLVFSSVHIGIIRIQVTMKNLATWSMTCVRESE